MENRGISKLDLKKINRMQILKVIRKNGPISRVDIAGILEITRAAVTILTNEMIEEGILFEVGEAPVETEHLQKGRRKILIDINPDFRLAVGVSINDSNIGIGISNLVSDIIDKNVMQYDEILSYDEIIDYIVNETKNLLLKNNLEASEVLGMGISIQPELCSKMKVYSKDGKLDFSKMIEIIESRLSMPITCMNSISAMALSNQEQEVSERFGNYIFIKFGKNINMSVLLENEVMHEYVNHTNMIERIVCRPNGAKLSGYPNGSVKAELTRDAIVKKYADILSKTDTPIFWEATEGKIENISHKTITLAASKGEVRVLEVLNDILKSMAVLINNLSAILFSRYIVLHDFHMNEWMFEYFLKIVADVCGEETAKKIRISRTENNLEFTSGCAISIYEFFYNTSGNLPQ